MVVTSAGTTNLSELSTNSEVVTAVQSLVTSRHGVSTCPHCGHPMVSDDVARALPKVQRRIYETIRDAGSAGISWVDCAARVYADDPTGGPTSNSISVLISRHLNPALAKRGLRLISRGGPGSVYRLVKLP